MHVLDFSVQTNKKFTNRWNQEWWWKGNFQMTSSNSKTPMTFPEVIAGDHL